MRKNARLKRALKDRMSNSHRREAILSRIESEHRVSVMELAEELGVTDETIRRDLKGLEVEGALRRVYGGAIPVARIDDDPISERDRRQAREKGIIASLARDYISDQTAIFLDTGTTTLTLARRLTGFANVKLYTNSLRIVEAAKDHHGVTIQVTPGRLRKVEQDLVGYDTVSFIQQFCFDVVFMGIAAIDIEHGFMDFGEDEARIRQALLKHARRRIFLVDSTKFGMSANVITAPFAADQIIITEQKVTERFAERFAKSGVEVIHG